MTGEARKELRVAVDAGVRRAIEETGRNPIGTVLDDDGLEGRRFDRVPLQRQGKHAAVFLAYVEYEGFPLD